jgi:monoamine oxidase
MDHADVIIIGAGLAGLTSARELIRAGKSVLVLEARDRVGGRLLTREVMPGVHLDLGGQWIGPTQDRVAALAHEFQLQTFPTYNLGHHTLFANNKISHYKGTIPNLGLRALLDIGRAQKKLDKMANMIPLHAPWEAVKAQEWDRQTFDTWIEKHMSTKAGKNGLHIFSEAVLAAQSHEFSLLHALFYIRSGSGFEKLIDTEKGAQRDRFVEGAQALATRLAEPFKDCIRLKTPARSIVQKSDSVVIETGQGAYGAKHAIVAIPPTLAGRILYDPPMPAVRDQLTQQLPHGAVIKCMAFYSTPFWREQGLSGFATGDNGAVKLIFDNSPQDGSTGVLLAFLEGERARELGCIPADERRQAVVNSLKLYFGERAAQPENYMDQDWVAEEWTRGCYGAHFPTGTWTQFGAALRKPVGRIHWAGTETATRWMGYMDGAIESGVRAAQEVLKVVDFGSQS